jgi:hypothetical protein
MGERDRGVRNATYGNEVKGGKEQVYPNVGGYR